MSRNSPHTQFRSLKTHASNSFLFSRISIFSRRIIFHSFPFLSFLLVPLLRLPPRSLCLCVSPPTSLRRVVPTARKWMAAADSAEPFPASANRAVLLDCFDHVMAAAWLISALGAKQRADRVLIESHERDQDPSRQFPKKSQRTVHQEDAPGGCGFFLVDFGGRLPLVEPAPRPSLRVSSKIARSIRAYSGLAPFRGRTTKSNPAGIRCRFLRNASRINRFQ
jgi:hypothetical protein